MRLLVISHESAKYGGGHRVRSSLVGKMISNRYNIPKTELNFNSQEIIDISSEDIVLVDLPLSLYDKLEIKNVRLAVFFDPSRAILDSYKGRRLVFRPYNFDLSDLNYEFNGPAYAPLRPAFESLSANFKENNLFENGLICFGASDPQNITETLLNHLSDLNLKGVRYKVLLGEHNLNASQIESRFNSNEAIRFYKGLKTEDLLLDIDHAFCSLGSIFFELNASGIPSLIVNHSQEHNQIARDMLKSYSMDPSLNLGVKDDLSKDSIIKALKSAKKPPEMKVCDGLGLKRIAEILDASLL